MTSVTPPARRWPLPTLALAVAFVAIIVGAVTVVVPRQAAVDEPTSTLIAVVGDSVSAGRNNEAVWPTLLSERTGWPVANFAQPDAGFVRDDQGGHAYAYQVERAAQVRPRVIVVMTGTADVEIAFSGAVAVAASDCFDRIKLLGIQALAVGPTWFDADVPDGLRAVSDQVRDAANRAGVPFLDGLNPPWLIGDQMQANLQGPNDVGQSVIADKVAAWLRQEVRP